MAYWWAGRNGERYWCEITDRADVGEDLWCPQKDEANKPYWSYSLINEVAHGDIVYHYYTPDRAFVGASVACGVVEESSIVHTPHGTVGRARHGDRQPRPAWRLPLTGYREARKAFPLAELDAPRERRWLEECIETTSRGAGHTMVPVQLYPGKLRGAQGYLTKMPADFLERWTPLRQMAEALAILQDDLTLPSLPRPLTTKSSGFAPKSSEPYTVVIRAAHRLHSRNHEKLVKTLGDVLIAKGARLETTRHPIDVFMPIPERIIIEAKAVGSRHPGHAVREAVGQLLEYRHFLGPEDAKLCIALDAEPSPDIVSYVEDSLQMLLLWAKDGVVYGGPRTASTLYSLGVRRSE
jgi:hypothetical protein